MTDQLSLLQKQKKELQEKITQKMFEFFEGNEYVKQQLSKLENGECNWLSANDINGVDYRLGFNAQKIAMEGIDLSEIKDCFGEWLSNMGGYFYDSKADEIVSSTGDEIFIQPWKNNLLLPESRKTKFVEYVDEFHCWLLAEEWMLENGIYPGVYDCDDHGNVQEWKWSDEVRKYAEFFPHDEKQREVMLNRYLALYAVIQGLENASHNIASLPSFLHDLIPDGVKKMDDEGELELLDIKEVTINKVVLKVGVDSDKELPNGVLLDDGNYELTVTIIPNAIHWIVEE